MGVSVSVCDREKEPRIDWFVKEEQKKKTKKQKEREITQTKQLWATSFELFWMLCLLYWTTRKKRKVHQSWSVNWERTALTYTIIACLFKSIEVLFFYTHAPEIKGNYDVLVVSSCQIPIFIACVMWHAVNTCCACRIMMHQDYKFGFEWLNVHIYRDIEA